MSSEEDKLLRLRNMKDKQMHEGPRHGDGARKRKLAPYHREHLHFGTEVLDGDEFPEFWDDDDGWF